MSRSRDYVNGVPSEIAERLWKRKKNVEPLPQQLKMILKVERVEVTLRLPKRVKSECLLGFYINGVKDCSGCAYFNGCHTAQ